MFESLFDRNRRENEEERQKLYRYTAEANRLKRPIVVGMTIYYGSGRDGIPIIGSVSPQSWKANPTAASDERQEVDQAEQRNDQQRNLQNHRRHGDA